MQTTKKPGCLRSERRFNRFIEEHPVIDGHELYTIDPQSFLDLMRTGANPFEYAYRVHAHKLEAGACVAGGTFEVGLVYNAEANEWSEPTAEKEGCEKACEECHCSDSV